LRLAAFSDWRTQPFEPLLDWMKSNDLDYALYAGDDTVRIADFTPLALREILDTDGFYNAEIGFGEYEDFVIEYSTMKKFRKRVERELKSLWRAPTELGFLRRHPPTDYGKKAPIWIGPKPKKKGNCLYYQRNTDSWIDEIAASTEHGLGTIVGNDCEYIDKLRLSRKCVNDLHSEPTIIDNVAFIGLEGSSGDIGIILYSEEEALAHLEKQWEFVTENEPDLVVLVSHAPPKGILDLSRRFGINNIGSQAVRDFIEGYEVDIVICGHSHINGGRLEEVDGCTVLNIASHDYQNAPGLVALIDIETNTAPRIKIERLFEFNSVLQSIHGVGEIRSRQLHEMGITSLGGISHRNRKKFLRLHGVGPNVIKKWILEAESLSQGTAYRISDNRWDRMIPEEVLIYDIETDSFQRNIWCIGLWNGQEKEFEQFFQKKSEQRLLRQFFRYLKRFSNLIPVTFSATDFDRRVVYSVAERHDIKCPKILRKEIDLGHLVVHRTIGTPKGGLKQLGPYFGYEWVDPTIDGAIVGMEYSNYLVNGTEIDWRKYCEYNKDDVMATLHVLNNLLELECIELE
jgi:Icc-related predicted phosphoesterase/uncharacterized protein YprB with RNaseH-like and TPR domain